MASLPGNPGVWASGPPAPTSHPREPRCRGPSLPNTPPPPPREPRHPRERRVTPVHPSPGRRQTPEAWKVLLGAVQEGAGQRWSEERGVARLVLHAAYIQVEEGRDLALVALDRAVAFGERVRAVCLPYGTHRFQLGAPCWARGRARGETGGWWAPGGTMLHTPSICPSIPPSICPSVPPSP